MGCQTDLSFSRDEFGPAPAPPPAVWDAGGSARKRSQRATRERETEASRQLLVTPTTTSGGSTTGENPSATGSRKAEQDNAGRHGGASGHQRDVKHGGKSATQHWPTFLSHLSATWLRGCNVGKNAPAAVAESGAADVSMRKYIRRTRFQLPACSRAQSASLKARFRVLWWWAQALPRA